MDDATPGSTPQHAAEELRFRLERGDGLCLNEHTVHSDSDLNLWITCGDAVLEHRESWTWPTILHDGDLAAAWWAEHRRSAAVDAWVNVTLAQHRAACAERIVGELLDQCDKFAAALDGIGETACTQSSQAWDTCGARRSQYLPWCKPCLAIDALEQWREAQS